MNFFSSFGAVGLVAARVFLPRRVGSSVNPTPERVSAPRPTRCTIRGRVTMFGSSCYDALRVLPWARE